MASFFFLFFVAFGKFFWSAAFGKLKLLMVVLYEVSHCWFLLFPYLHQENCWPTWLQFGYYVPSLLKDLRIGGLCFPKTIRSQSFPSWVVEKTHGRHPGPFSGTPTFFNFYSFFFFSFLSIRFSQISYDTIRQDNSSIGSVILDHEYNLVSNMLRKSISWIAFVFCYALSCMDSSSTDLLLHFSFIEVHIFNHPNHLTSCSVVNL